MDDGAKIAVFDSQACHLVRLDDVASKKKGFEQGSDNLLEAVSYDANEDLR